MEPIINRYTPAWALPDDVTKTHGAPAYLTSIGVASLRRSVASIDIAGYSGIGGGGNAVEPISDEGLTIWHAMGRGNGETLASLADRVAIMKDGEIQQVDPPQRLYDFPANRVVAEFVGDPAMNTFDVTIDREGERFYAGCEGFRIRLPSGDALDSLAGSSVVLGIRPEDISHARAAAPTDPTAFEAAVVVTGSLGDSLLLECQVGGISFKAHVDPRSTV